MAKEYIERDVVLSHKWEVRSYDPSDPDPVTEVVSVSSILRIPAADVVEVRHASWVWNPDGMDWGIGAWVCGKCKVRPETWWNTVKESHPLRCSGSRYCGNCGAVMGGGQDDV